MRDQWNLSKKWGVPKEYISCPGCGFGYGYQHRKYCPDCQECSSCCLCQNKTQHVAVTDELIESLIEDM